MSEPCEFCGQELGPEHERHEVSLFGAPMTIKTCPNMPKRWLMMSNRNDVLVAELDLDDD